jgi:hypothetical protein
MLSSTLRFPHTLSGQIPEGNKTLVTQSESMSHRGQFSSFIQCDVHYSMSFCFAGENVKRTLPMPILQLNSHYIAFALRVL